MKNKLPLVSIIIPCRNEEKFIENRIKSLLKDGYPLQKIEILIIDGKSEDKTRDIIKEYAVKFPFIKLLDNNKKETAYAFNIGINHAIGEIIILMSAHTSDEKGYIEKCIKYMYEYNIDSVIGIMKATPSKNTIMAKSIAISLSVFFGAGNSYFRIGSNSPKLIDTAGSCYKKQVFQKIGFFNEKLKRSQDMDFSLRMNRAGIKTLLIPDIITYYYPKDNLKDFFIHNFEDGIWAILPFKFIKRPLKLRHYIPLIFVLTLPLSIWPYILVNLFFSAQIALREKDLKYFFVVPLVFVTRHIGYGLGSFLGLIKLIF
ncbi:MAG: hypothetical protein A3F15_00360 [Candidatus Wildermuthbacteria bacterium RIFCSPHIGHO2_12_FULL_40_12]|uniref:Glycosyltransferase 2-like domain-containing protein n=1 Tax=Candidatus Wildermuthbacteria bacterium RIFCSPHIGHO2_12_FULL_40_12 TaxID=1802457 RepID=A0A1G2RCD1_9BACT|nr:MAG: hypothetical protein A3F15_00360 [Candidatus Wildermuthbacteria bacterium RIFCSPHIGHO2_12_FULL_40_12]